MSKEKDNSILLNLTFRKFQSDGFPKVFKGYGTKGPYIQIVYLDHCELYWLDSKWYKSGEEPFDLENELEMVKGANCKEVRCALVNETIADQVEIILDSEDIQ
jgi:hypothetical protein